MESKRFTTPAFLETQVIIQRAREGNSGAWEELFRRYRALLTVMVHVRIPALYRGRFDTEDVLQSAFLAAWEEIEGFEYQGEGSFRRWLTQVVVNKLLDQMRLNARAKRAPSAEAQGVIAHEDERQLISREEPIDELLRVERQSEVLAAMSDLPEENQELICMRIFERLTFEEIAVIQGTSCSTARRRFASAIERLTDRLT